ncbi:MAG: protein translocase subunit SecD [Candidatus Marinimicrobia bacterium]|nr:protein translocase subunit SecD [Candidatus Neomarinimicrobiota bacterium]|tara:strand:+ start:62803 stop:64548 length:1746 start_codon:yes stop_codon:yes gene_type:complete
MLDNLKLRWLVIVCTLAGSLYYIYPSVDYYVFNNLSKQKESLNLGLDLKGGLNIILELDDYLFLKRLSKKNLSKQSKNKFNEILKNAQENANNNNTQLIKELEIYSKSNNIKLNKYFSNLSKSSDNYQVIQEINSQHDYAMQSILDVMRNRIEDHDQYGLGEPSIQKLGDNRLVVELAGVSDISKAKKYIQRTADFELSLVKSQNQLTDIIMKIQSYIDSNMDSSILIDSLMIPDGGSEGYLVNSENVQVIKNLLKLDAINDLIKSNSKIVWDNKSLAYYNQDNQYVEYQKLYLVSSNPAISGGMIQTPKAVVADMGNNNAGQWVVNLDMNKEGRKKWSKFTGANINRQVAIILDDLVFMAPFIRDKISSGSTQISGFESMEEAKDIASVLKAGELPAPISIVQTNYVGPSLGKDSINDGGKSMIIGLILVLIFMLLYYKGSGLIANMAVVCNIIIVFGVLYTMNAVLTLPGIAGLLLTIGMSVDANVIIFERIKEEINSKTPNYAAIKNGYNKAFITILDANITTLLTAFILSFLGSGPIVGFATTLSVGILCSMFTAIFFTKTIFLTLFKINKIKNLSI